MFNLEKIYNEKEQAKQVNTQNVQIEEKRGTRSLNETKSYVRIYLKKINRLKKRQMLNGIKDVVISEMDPTQLSFQLMKRN